MLATAAVLASLYLPFGRRRAAIPLAAAAPHLRPTPRPAAGALVFEPASLTVAKGESITFVNNAGFPHNVVFDEDEVPEGVNAEAISHEDYLNAPGETFSIKLDAAGSYSYYCEPHQGAGMAGARQLVVPVVPVLVPHLGDAFGAAAFLVLWATAS